MQARAHRVPIGPSMSQLCSLLGGFQPSSVSSVPRCGHTFKVCWNPFPGTRSGVAHRQQGCGQKQDVRGWPEATPSERSLIPVMDCVGTKCSCRNFNRLGMG